MFAARADAGRRGAHPAPPRRAAGKPRPRLPAPGIGLGYIALTATFAAILGVALATFTATNSNTHTIAPALSGAPTNIVTINAATTGTGRIAGGEEMSPALIYNLGARSALTSAVGRF